MECVILKMMSACNVHLQISAAPPKPHRHVIGHDLHTNHRERLVLGGITLPGMMDDPGSFSGILSSQSPHGAHMT